MPELTVKHFEQAIELLRQGNCLVNGQNFNMERWDSCLCGSASTLAFGQPLEDGLPKGWVSGKNIKQKVHIAAMVMMTLSSDADIIKEWDARKANRWSLKGANLRGTDLRDADLRDADLRDANLSNANLRDADLRGTDLQFADLRGTDLRCTDLSQADLQLATYNDKTQFPSGFDLAKNGIKEG
jgi:uncharacterized protein YjbI with pentapeptide repeats